LGEGASAATAELADTVTDVSIRATRSLTGTGCPSMSILRLSLHVRNIEGEKRLR
jgi:hypothetical protein